MQTKSKPAIRVGSRLGKYRIEKRLGVGGFATVYSAFDTLLGIKVALKVPSPELVSEQLLEEFRREAKLTIQLDHPNILAIRDATFVDDHFVIISPLAERTLHDRLQKRMGFELAFDILAQLLDGVAYAHDQGVIHCDIKPENVLMFDDNQIRLADFGIAKASQRTINGSGTGTIGYMAPEQAMGKPSARSDVFSIGLLAYRLFSGKWPEYPFEWPLAGAIQLRRRAHSDLIAVIRKSLNINPRGRYRNAGQMYAAVEQTRLKATRYARRHRTTG
ncbi:serine/threonine-protein kinase [Novipirellula artificiosorum]|uniref:Serine/threonine-protein kinase PK-1 n=1 Tax=Novipirellula artificiosorum TaxID=2528016 RepID=A0A5C6DH26_9BACT|nr:serine/threonine-protein kinase [Novipirellula artificiosorum]TWU36160.1 Serine/threonine-protein kinase PK-1 [Novipirellula artificiosorum]